MGPFEENNPLNISALDGMLGPCDCTAEGSPLPDLRSVVASQPADIITASRELIPKLNLVFRPQRRLELLLRTFGWKFVARGREPVGIVCLSICICRKAAEMPHTAP